MGDGKVACYVTLQFNPMRRGDAGLIVAEAGSIRYGPALRSDAVARCDAGDCMLRARIERLTDHHTSLRPAVRVLDTFDSGSNRAGAAEHLVREVKLVGHVPDISAGGGHCVRAGGAFDKAADRARKTMEPQG